MTDSTLHAAKSPRWSPALVAELEQSATPADAAAVLASAGVPVFPCVPHQKNPLTEHGFHDASTEASIVAEWWRQRPAANVAMPTGFASGVDVVDIDVHASGSGFDALQQARSAGLLGTPAWVVSTPSGGMHACFLRTGSVAQRSWQVPGRHVDFRGDGGYVVLPPSTVVQPDGEARPYRVVNVATRQPDAVNANALRRFLEPPRPTRPPVDLPTRGARPDRLASWVATRGEGERNQGLFWASCRMAESGERFDVAATVLGEAAQSAGLTAREAMTTIRSAYRIANRLGPPSVAGERLGPSRAAGGAPLTLIADRTDLSRLHEEPSMNGPDPYDRRLDRLADEAGPRPEATQAADPPALAVRRDPSQQPVMPSQQGAQGIAWVRPTELAMRVGSPVVGRGIDLQTTLATRARRAPSSIAKAGHRTTRSAIARAATTTAHEGVEL